MILYFRLCLNAFGFFLGISACSVLSFNCIQTLAVMFYAICAECLFCLCLLCVGCSSDKSISMYLGLGTRAGEINNL